MSIQDKLQELDQKYQHFIDNVTQEHSYMIDHFINQLNICNQQLSYNFNQQSYYNVPAFYNNYPQNYQNQYYYPQNQQQFYPNPNQMNFTPMAPPVPQPQMYPNQNYYGNQMMNNQMMNQMNNQMMNQTINNQMNNRMNSNNNNIQGNRGNQNIRRRNGNPMLSLFGQLFNNSQGMTTRQTQNNQRQATVENNNFENNNFDDIFDNIFDNFSREEYTDNNGNRISIEQYGGTIGNGSGNGLGGGSMFSLMTGGTNGFGNLNIRNFFQDMLNTLQRQEEDVIVPLPQEIINNIGITNYSQEIYSEHDPTCAICQEDYIENENIRELPCEHLFHQDCIDEWFSENVSCPICRKDIRDFFEESESDESQELNE